MGLHLQRAMQLLELSRPADAEKELRAELGKEPGNPIAHALLAICLSEREAFDEAEREAAEAIRAAPDLPYAHYAMGIVLQDRRRPKEAARAATEAIRLDPYDPDPWALLGQIHMTEERWSEALQAATSGLEADPEHVACTNLRAAALVKLGRRDEAGLSLDAALSRAPEDATTHANKGWACLHAGDPKGAQVHLREALRLEPDHEWARAGIVEALKARNVVYRGMLAYFLWMSRLSGRARWGVVIGGLVGYNVLRNVSRQNASLARWILPLLIAYAAFVLMTWLADPLFNLLLRLDRFGRHALSRDQVVAANWLGGCLLAALLMLGAWLFTGDFRWLLGALFQALLVIPVTGTLRCERGWPRAVMGIYTAGLAVLGAGAVLLPPPGLGEAFAVGIALSTWLGSWLGGVTPQR